MNNQIRTYNDLLEEKQRLQTLLAIQKQQINSHWLEVKEELAPVSHTINFLGKFTSRDKSNPLLNIGIDLAGNLLLKNFILSKADWVTRLLVPYFAKNYSTNVVASKGGNLFRKIRNIFRKNGRANTDVTLE